MRATPLPLLAAGAGASVNVSTGGVHDDDGSMVPVPAPASPGPDDDLAKDITELLLEVPSFPQYKSDFMNALPKEQVVEEDDVGLPSLREADEGVFVAHRINHASQRANAVVVSHNPEATGASSLLGGDSDHYYMTPCSAPKKWVVIALSEDVRGSGLVLAAVAACAGPPPTLLGRVAAVVGCLARACAVTGLSAARLPSLR